MDLSASRQCAPLLSEILFWLMCGDSQGEMKVKAPSSNEKSTTAVSREQEQPVPSAVCNQLELAGVCSLNWFFSRQSNSLHTVPALVEFTREISHNLAAIQLWGMREICSSLSVSLTPPREELSAAKSHQDVVRLPGSYWKPSRVKLLYLHLWKLWAKLKQLPANVKLWLLGI